MDDSRDIGTSTLVDEGKFNSGEVKFYFRNLSFEIIIIANNRNNGKYGLGLYEKRIDCNEGIIFDYCNVIIS